MYRNIVKHLDFDIIIGADKITYTNKKDVEDKTIWLEQISYVPKDANPNANTTVRRPYSLTITRNNNKVVSIQNINTPNQILEPVIWILPHESYKIEISGYDGTAEIFLMGEVEEPEGTNINL